MSAEVAFDLGRVGDPEGVTVGDLPSQPSTVHVELIAGSLVVTPIGDLVHQAIVTDLASRLRPAVPTGLLVLAGVNVIDGDRTLLIPDVAVVDPSVTVRDGLGVPPEGLQLVIEVSSPSTRVYDLTVKRELYRQWAVPYVLVDRSVAPPTALVEGDLPAWAHVVLAPA